MPYVVMHTRAPHPEKIKDQSHTIWYTLSVRNHSSLSTCNMHNWSVKPVILIQEQRSSRNKTSVGSEALHGL